MTPEENFLNVSSGSMSDSSGIMEVTDSPEDASWFLPTQPDLVSDVTINSTIADANYTMPELPDWCMYTYCGLVGFGLISNTLNIVVFARLKSSIMYIYLWWIAFLELCFCIFLAPGIAMLRIHCTASYLFALLNFRIFQLLWYIASSASTLLTVVIAYDRIYHIKCPLTARADMTKKRALHMVVIIILVCIALRIPFILNLQIVPVTTLNGTTLYKGKLVNTLELSFTVPVYIMAFVFDYFSPTSLSICSVIILYYMHKIAKERKRIMAVHIAEGNAVATGNQPFLNVPPDEEKLRIVLLVMSLMSIICNVPVTILRLIWPETAKHFDLKNIANFLYIFDHICSVFIYTATDKAYWEQLVSLLKPSSSNESNGSPSPDHQNVATIESVQLHEITLNRI